MADIVLVTVILAFTALCVAYISWCDKIIGSDDLLIASDHAPEQPVAAPATPADVRPAGVTS
jgi:hypothetical protein